jgi:hypothetical protein
MTQFEAKTLKDIDRLATRMGCVESANLAKQIFSACFESIQDTEKLFLNKTQSFVECSVYAKSVKGMVESLEEKPEKLLKKMDALGIECLCLAPKFHTWHVNVRSGFRHEVLQKIYELLTELGDQLLENAADNKREIDVNPTFGEWNSKFDEKIACDELQRVIDMVKELAVLLNEHDIDVADILGTNSSELVSLHYKLGNLE